MMLVKKWQEFRRICGMDGQSTIIKMHRKIGELSVL